MHDKRCYFNGVSKADADAWSDGCSSKYAISGSVISTVSRL